MNAHPDVNMQHRKTQTISLGKNDVVLFQGDSITDAGRNLQAEDQANHGAALGNGYAAIIAAGLLIDHSELGLKIYNRGISGNKVPDLDERWQADVIDLRPAVLSILIGVNDIWHHMDGNYAGTPENYRNGFAALLERTKAALPDVTLVICEPFVLRCGVVMDSWFPEFDQRRSYARQVAERVRALWVPFQEAFDSALSAGTAPQLWTGDGVHPTIGGHALMAATWRRATGI